MKFYTLQLQFAFYREIKLSTQFSPIINSKIGN